jgi:hypothetical protein
MRAISTFKRDEGMSTRACRAIVAFRMRDSMSAIGSVIFLSSQLSALGYQLFLLQLLATPPFDLKADCSELTASSP